MMTPANGYEDEERIVHDSNAMLSMEMESLHPGAASVRTKKPTSKNVPHPLHCLSQLCMLIKLHIEYYPKIFSTIGLVALVFGMYIAVEFSKPQIPRHKISHDYSNITMDYNFKAAQIDHWCLFGGDTACQCDDFTEPVSREEIKGWLEAHNANKARIQNGYDYDVVFLGDDVVEEMNGNWYNIPQPDGKRIRDDFNKTFTVADDEETTGDLDGLALGIAGDSSANLLWRIQHGEMSDKLFSKVWWIAIGSNDLARGGCSEEATVLGILRVAEEVYFNNPGSVVVVQGILPRSTTGGPSLEPVNKSFNPLFGKKHSEQYYADKARANFQLWPSIQAVNKQLEDFCKEHGHIVYFDASNLFLGSVSNSLYKSSAVQIVTELMPDYVHLGYEGHKVLNKAIKEEVQRIILDEDEDNDIEEKENNN